MLSRRFLRKTVWPMTRYCRHRGRIDTRTLDHRYQSSSFVDRQSQRATPTRQIGLLGGPRHVCEHRNDGSCGSRVARRWLGEKEGTFINSERRIGLCKRVKRAPGRALADFSILRLIAERWGCGTWFRSWKDPETVFQLLKRISAGQPCDITGIDDYQMVDRCGGIQWPFTISDRHQFQRRLDELGDFEQAWLPFRERRLFEDGRFHHQDGKARFFSAAPQPVPESTCDQFPFILLTGRGASVSGIRRPGRPRARFFVPCILRNLLSKYIRPTPDDCRLGTIIGDHPQSPWIGHRPFTSDNINPVRSGIPRHA